MTSIEIACLVVICSICVGGLIIAPFVFIDKGERLNERQIQAQLDAVINEQQRQRFRLRRIEDKLGIKEEEK